ncbi:MAG: alpha/beta hydrolase [Phaeodactylibacter sp.]|nr:alpha/beta hydrolase [Phaeodactylibacter sp.]
MKKIFLLMPLALFACSSETATNSQEPTSEKEKCEVTLVEATNGSYAVSPELPADGKAAKGTTLAITAHPAPGYRLDAVYQTVLGGMWGQTHREWFVPEQEITIDTTSWIGAVFVPESLVDNLEVTRDVVYAQPGVKPLKYDVFAPKGAENLPGIIIIHGGGWSSNNEDIMRGLAWELTKGNQYVVFSIDYRWVNELDGDERPNSMHNLIEDVFGAIAHIQEHAANYGCDPSRLALTGDSAGGHLSAAGALLCPMIGDGGFGEVEGVYEYKPTYIPEGKSLEQLKTEITQAVQAVAPSYGPFDAADFKDFIRQKDQSYLDAVSPIRHVPNAKARSIPHYIVRGTADEIVPNKAVLPYVELLKAQGQVVEYVQVEGAGHAFFDWKPDAQTRQTFAEIGVPYAAQMKAFFDRVFYGAE